ncbi:hypothetical protein SAMN04488565_1435 [Leucobacter chromiiresistens]|uniref:Uncharacterized protein n=1 Tax=Leucobacter chromiiresistens TaxID=1079994 RepID=A0A1H0Z4M6_9MICO|nr:hypothetical protein SAMN04488565_1435 [Leucobacter chromiiresistens]
MHINRGCIDHTSDHLRDEAVGPKVCRDSFPGKMHRREVRQGDVDFGWLDVLFGFFFRVFICTDAGFSEWVFPVSLVVVSFLDRQMASVVDDDERYRVVRIVFSAELLQEVDEPVSFVW